MNAKYIIRLDDASEFMNFKKWQPFFEIIDSYRLKPIISVIPFNKDPKMINDHPDLNFWDKVRIWQDKGYRIAVHGYEHYYKNNNSGLIGFNRYSEFSGIPFVEQRRMLLEAKKKFQSENVIAEIFVAPAHTFDNNTLKALLEIKDIHFISDGFFINPIYKDKLCWIPQQLWSPSVKKKGVWTVCYHPETSNLNDIELLKTFLSKYNHYFVDPLSLEFKSMRTEDILFSLRSRLLNKIRCISKIRLP